MLPIPLPKTVSFWPDIDNYQKDQKEPGLDINHQFADINRYTARVD